MQVENDSDLVRRARAGDKHAFGKLITRHQPMVQRVAYQLTRDQELARDLAQEAWLAAYLSLAHLREPERFAKDSAGRGQGTFAQITPAPANAIVSGLCRIYFADDRARREPIYDFRNHCGCCPP